MYAYVLLDFWSSKVAGWEIHDRETPELASQCFDRIVTRNGARPDYLHSDNDNPMKGLSMLVTRHSLGVMPSSSWPRVSNDNAYSEVLFKSAQYVPFYPRYFTSIVRSQQWFADFVHW